MTLAASVLEFKSILILELSKQFLSCFFVNFALRTTEYEL